MITDEGLKHIARISKLAKLDIEDCENVTKTGLLSILLGLKHLSELNITSCDNIPQSVISQLSGILNITS
jgi:Asp-tRNA(Asn)/Glu-tRNA(Gln) amidotransferase C subunit